MVIGVPLFAAEQDMSGRERAVHWDPEKGRAIAVELKHIEGPLMPILHAINDRFGHINNEAIKNVARQALDRSR